MTHLKLELKALLITLLIAVLPLQSALSCDELFVDYTDSPFVQRINEKLLNPKYKVLVLARHGRAAQKNNMSPKERSKFPKKIPLDVDRSLTKTGKRQARHLAALMSHLNFREIGMWGSYAKRVVNTAKPTASALDEMLEFSSFEEDLYYSDVPTEMKIRLTSDLGKGIDHAFFWGHGQTTMALYDELSNTQGNFLPMGGAVFIILKAKKWKRIFQSDSRVVEAYSWSPNRSRDNGFRKMRIPK